MADQCSSPGTYPRQLTIIAKTKQKAANRRARNSGAKSSEHLARCPVHIDLNMVRAGVVTHPPHWETGGYQESRRERPRHRVVDRKALAEVLGIEWPCLAEAHRQWAEAAVRSDAIRGGGGSSEPSIDRSPSPRTRRATPPPHRNSSALRPAPATSKRWPPPGTICRGGEGGVPWLS